MHRRGRIWLTCLASVAAVLSLVTAIYVGGEASIGSWLTAIAMGLVVLSQLFMLRKQDKPPTR
jgi:hypothetical protein